MDPPGKLWFGIIKMHRALLDQYHLIAQDIFLSHPAVMPYFISIESGMQIAKKTGLAISLNPKTTILAYMR